MPAIFRNSAEIEGYVLNPPKVFKRQIRFRVAHHFFAPGRRGQFWQDCCAFGKRAEKILALDLRPGDLVFCEGKLKGRKPKGYDHYTTEVMVNKVEVVQRGKKHPDGGGEQFIGTPEGI